MQKINRDYSIDCFRILALLMVLSVHFRGGIELPIIVDKLFGFGAYGVALYFLISGYLVVESVNRQTSYAAYVFQKAMNILPMYWMSLILTFVIAALWLKKYPVSWEWIYHVFLINMFIPAKEWMWWNSVNYFWTMPAFMGWYLLAPILLKFLNTARGWAFVTFLTAVSTPLLKQWMNTIANRQFVNWNFLCLLYIFCLGCLVWFVVKEKRYKEGLVYGFGIGSIGWIAGNTSGFLVFGVGFYTIILLFKILKIRFENKKVQVVVSLLSTSTYAVYLIHYFVLLFWESGYLPHMSWFISYILFLMASWGVGIFFQRVMKWTGRVKIIR